MKHILLAFFLLALHPSFSTTRERIENELIIQVSPENSNRAYLEALFPQTTITPTAISFHIWKIKFPDSIPIDYVRKLYRNNEIINFIRNRSLEPRATTPNDPLFSRQPYHFNNIHATYGIPSGINSVGAWDYNKSAFTALGDTIVVAVCDFGFDTIHEDLDYFINNNEIPYNGIDDDNNGAKDDYRGWNVGDNNHILMGTKPNHGMTVAGRIAAKGNNGKGVTGVAWNCKLLPLNNIAAIDFSIQAFEYIIRMKRLYLSTNKQKGAYIVAVNYSLGVSNLFTPADEPLWCAIFDSLGKVGILASCAVDNTQNDVESYKDMPILCNSPYMINVTACDSALIGLSGSGYSKKYVHLAAPNRYYSTLINNQYGEYNPPGASYSAPLVAGTIALMYSNFQSKLLDTLHRNPLLVTSKIKQIIINSVDISPNLINKMVSDGKLNVYKTILKSRTLQDSFFKSSSIYSGKPLMAEPIVYAYDKKIGVKKPNHLPLFLSVYNMIGQEVYKKEIIEMESDLDIHHLFSGIYIAFYQYENQYFSTKIVLE